MLLYPCQQSFEQLLVMTCYNNMMVAYRFFQEIFGFPLVREFHRQLRATKACRGLVAHQCPLFGKMA